MAKSKGDIVQSILNSYRPETYIKKIKVGFDSHEDGSIILKVNFEIEKDELEDKKPNKERLIFISKELANKIKKETKLPIKFTQTTVKYL